MLKKSDALSNRARCQTSANEEDKEGIELTVFPNS